MWKPPDASRRPFVVVIPARYASSRLPGKPLADIGGKPMIVRVAERAQMSGATSVVVATDHEAVRAAAQEGGFKAMMTDKSHESGTDRIAEVIKRLRLPRDTIVVNVQGDEPLIDPRLISLVAESLERDDRASVSTACHVLRSASEWFNPNVVKVVLDRSGTAMYFSRAPIPWARDAIAAIRRANPTAMPQRIPRGLRCYRHIGIYAYRASFLAKFASLRPSELERFEALEQLRIISHGYRLAVAVSRRIPEAGVDTPEDLERVRAHVTRNEKIARRGTVAGMARASRRSSTNPSSIKRGGI